MPLSLLRTAAGVTALAGALFAGAAAAKEPTHAIGARASIPFVSQNVRTFQPDWRGEGVYIQDYRRTWYYARFFSRCNELPFALAVGFQTWGGTLERGDSLLVRGERCRIAELTYSAPPPPKKKRTKAD